MNFYLKIIFLIFANLLVKPIYIFGVEIQVFNFIGAEMYGQYTSLLGLSIVFSTILDGGINHYHNLRIAKNPTTLQDRLLPTLAVKLGLSALYFIVVLVAGWVLAYTMQQLQILAIIVLIQTFVSLLTFNRFTLSALHYFKLDSLASVLDKLLMIAIIGGAMYWQTHNFTIYTYVWGQAVALFIAFAISIIFVVYKNKYIQKLSFNFDWQQYKDIIKASLPYAFLAVLIGLYTRTDAIMLERILPDNGYEAGIYGAGFRLLEAVSQVAMMVSFWLVSVYAKLFEENNMVKIRTITTQITSVAMVGSVGISLICWWWQVDIMQFCYKDATTQYAYVFAWLMLSLPSKVLLYIVGTLLTAAEKIKLLNYIALVGVVFNLLLNYLLIPKFGAWGAAVTTLFTQSLVVSVQCFFAYKLLFKKY